MSRIPVIDSARRVPARRPGLRLIDLTVASRDLVEASGLALVTGGLVLAAGFGLPAVLLFLAGGTLLTVTAPAAACAALARHWLLLAFPVWAMVSVLWSADPPATLRAALQTIVTVALCLIAIETTGRRVLILTTAVVLVAALHSIALSDRTEVIWFTGDRVRIGIFGSKNNASLIAGECLLLAFLLAACAPRDSLVRWIALPIAVIACGALIAAKSLGTILAVALCLGVATLLALLSAGTTVALRRGLLVAIALTLLAGAVWLAVTTGADSYRQAMQAIGKDPTLTGRTQIWAVGWASVTQHPWLGIGHYAFWRAENPTAVLLWTMARREIGAPFGFHNLYLHHWVETGAIGAGLVAAAMVRLLAAVWTRTVAGFSARGAAATALGLFFVAKSLVETVGFEAFSFHTFTFILAWCLLTEPGPDPTP